MNSSMSHAELTDVTRGNHAVRRAQRFFSTDIDPPYTPPVSDRIGDRENPVAKPYQQFTMEPLLNLRTAASWRKHNESLADFTNREPFHNARLGPIPAEF
jgi:hypothetical protein